MEKTKFICPECDAAKRPRSLLLNDRGTYWCEKCDSKYTKSLLLEIYTGIADELQSDAEWMREQMIAPLAA